MMTTIRIVILGDHKVGKSAVTVRFLTRRFIGEYSSDIDLLYRSSIKQDDVFVDIEVLDTCTRPVSKSIVKDAGLIFMSTTKGQKVRVDETRASWADAFVVVYSILSRASFNTARALIESINRVRTSAYIPMMLLGNMIDLDHRREVGVEEGHQVAVEFGCQYFEVSAAENIMGISLAFQAFLREAKIVQQQKSTMIKRRRSSLANMSKRLGAMFGKKEPNSSGGTENSAGRRGSVEVKDIAKT